MPACTSEDRAIFSSSILRDMKLVALSFLATCFVIFAYNYTLEWRCLTKSEKNNVSLWGAHLVLTTADEFRTTLILFVSLKLPYFMAMQAPNIDFRNVAFPNDLIFF